MLPTLKKLHQKYQYSMIYGLYIQCHNSKKLWLWIFFLLLELENVLPTLKGFTLKAYNI